MHAARLVAFALPICLACARTPAPAATADASSPAPASPEKSETPAPADRVVAKSQLPKDLDASYQRADAIAVGIITNPRMQTLETDPPQYVHNFDVSVENQRTGGQLPARFPVTFSSRSQNKPFASNTSMVVALRRIESTWPTPSTAYEALRVEPPTPELLAKLAVLSPAPAGLSLSIAQVPGPKDARNALGDGVFELTLRNDSASAITIAGVLTNDKQEWAHALEVHDEEGRRLALPHRSDATKPLTLAPHAAIKTTLDVKPFGVVRPVGGGRLTYSFALGPISTSSWFYYVHDIHGPMMGKP